MKGETNINNKLEFSSGDQEFFKDPCVDQFLREQNMTREEFLQNEKNLKVEIDDLNRQVIQQQVKTKKTLNFSNELNDDMVSLCSTQLFKDLAYVKSKDIDKIFSEQFHNDPNLKLIKQQLAIQGQNFYEKSKADQLSDIKESKESC